MQENAVCAAKSSGISRAELEEMLRILYEE